MGGHDLGNTRSNPAEQLLTPSTVGALATAWTVIWSRSVPELAGITDTFSRTSPAIAGDTVYIGTKAGAVLLAIDTQTGDLRWRTPMDPHPRAVLTSSPVVHEGVVYQGVSSNEFLDAGDPNYDRCTFRGSLVAVDAWEFQGEGSSNAGPAIVDGRLYWGNGYQRIQTPSTTFYAFALP